MIREGILRGHLPVQALRRTAQPQVTLFGSGPILNEALKAQEILAEKYGDQRRCLERHQLQRTAARCAGQWNAGTGCIPPKPRRKPYVLEALGEIDRPIVAASDYMKIVPDQLAPWLPGRLTSLGTDGFGRSRKSRAPAPLLRGRRCLDCCRGARIACSLGPV